jgi:hypothetical protein
MEDLAVKAIQKSTNLTPHQKLLVLSPVSLMETIHFVSRNNHVLPPHRPTHISPHLDVWEAQFSIPTGTPSVRLFGRHCPALEVYVVKKMGHQWPSGVELLPAKLYGRTSKHLATCERVWRFFSAVGDHLL